MTEVAPHGTWASPISAADVAREGGSLGWLDWVGEDLYWTESRPTEHGRVSLMRSRAGQPAAEVLPAPWYVRSRVIEYGGRAWAGRATGLASTGLASTGSASTGLAGARGPVLVFANWADQRLYRLEPDQPGSTPQPVSPPAGHGMRFADFFVHPERDEVWGVRETSTGPEPTDVRRDIVAVPLDGSAASDPSLVRVLAASHHFLAGPRLSPDGERLCWIGWDHPSMPWDETVLCVAEVSAGEAGPAQAGPPEAQVVAGGGRQAVIQAEWAGPRTLLYLSDPTGWWNLYRLPLDGPGAGRPEALCPREEEFGDALWQLGMRWFAPLADGLIAAVHGGDITRLSILGPDGVLRDVAAPYTDWAASLAAHAGTVAAVAASTERPHEIVSVDAASREVRLLHAAPGGVMDAAYLPKPEARTFRGGDSRDIYANVYPPRNPGFTGSPGQPPPFVVFVHGGPTGRSPLVYDLEIGYFTSRGIGVVDVNYGGSTGHGRAYRERLVHNWGVVDTADCAEVALALAAEGTADRGRLAIRGGSAGGWTTACSLVGADVIYRGGVICYPVLDLVADRAGGTHDFESQYLDSMVGPWPQAEQVYHDRSPVNHAGEIHVPFLLLQGLEDVICPPAQSERLLERMAGRGIPHAYLAFAGEQHGFRQASTIIAALEAELSFLGQVLGFEPRGVPQLELTT